MPPRNIDKEEADLKYDLRETIKSLLNTLTPTTERYATLETTIHHILQILDAYDHETVLTVVGQPKSGKSSLINALLGMQVIPPGLSRSLAVVPFVSETPMLRLVSGKAVACGEEGCREHLQGEETLFVEALGDRRLHAPLPVIKGPQHYRSRWVCVDSASGASCILPKLSSVATRVATPTYFAGAMILFCVDATKLKTKDESSLLDAFFGSTEPSDVSMTTLERLLQRTVFVLTHSDYITEQEDDVQPVLKKDMDEKTTIRTIAELRSYFAQLVSSKLHGRFQVDPARIVTFSGRNAFLTNRILMFEPEMQELYDYCEVMFGAAFMQTIDDLEVDYIRRLVARFASETMLERSGARELTKLFRLFDFNSGRHLLAYCSCLALDSVEQLDVALEAAKPFVLREVSNYREELDVLIKETTWVLESTESISAFAKEIVDETVSVASRCLKEFFQERLHELRYILEGRDLAWFRERQACTVMDMKTSFNKLKTFTETYLFQRGFLEKKIYEQRASAGGWEFLDQSPLEVLKAMEREKQEILIDFNTKVAHHIKDEYERFLPTMIERIQAKKKQMTDTYLGMVMPPITETENRIGESLDMDNLLDAMAKAELVEGNERRVKNFLRELPEHVAVAAVEISNQWYVPKSDEELTNIKIPTKREEYEKRLKAASAREGDVEDEGEFRMPSELLYVLESWRLSFSMVQLHQLCTYNAHTFTHAVETANERVLDFVNRLVVSLEEGAVSQKENVEESEQVVVELGDVRTAIRPITERLRQILKVIDDGMVTSLEEAEAIANCAEY